MGHTFSQKDIDKALEYIGMAESCIREAKALLGVDTKEPKVAVVTLSREDILFQVPESLLRQTAPPTI